VAVLEFQGIDVAARGRIVLTTKVLNETSDAGAAAGAVDPGRAADSTGSPAARRESALARWVGRYCGGDLYVRACRHAPGLIGAGVLVILCAGSVLFADAAVTRSVHASGIQAWVHGQPFVTEVVRWPGHFLFAGVLALVLWFCHRWGWRGAVILMGACLISGSNWFLKWVAGRHRPNEHTGMASFEFAPFRGGWAGLFHQRNLSMPSGDVSLAFAVAATVAWLMPRWRWAFYAGAALVACERVAENAHHLSDVLAGAALGIVSFHLGHLAVSLLGAKTARDLGIERPANAQ
jgi:membrane-associated phospholipid phosphatase